MLRWAWLNADVNPPAPAAAPPLFNAERALALARETLDIEARAIEGLKARQGDAFVAVVRKMLECRGRVVVMGMGKSGHVGRKVAATLASTGTPAFFVHPAEACALARLQAEQGAGLDVESVARELQRTHRIESGKGSVGRHGRHVASSRIGRF